MNEPAFDELRLLVERVVGPVRASRWAKGKVRAELLAHVAAVFEEELAALGDERLALERTAQRFGDSAYLTAGLQESIALGGRMAWLKELFWLRLTGNITMNHNRLYNGLLASLCLFNLAGMWPLLLLMQLPPDGRPRTHLPGWSLPFITVGTAIYLVAMIVTLISRLAYPDIGKRLTTAMNVLFLIAPPVGTVVGIYGLWKVERVER